MPQSATYRRRQLDLARTRGEQLVERDILPVLQARYRALSRELRQGNLRKRLKKSGGILLRKEGETEQSTWDAWIAQFENALTAALADGAGFIWDVDVRYFASFNYPTFPFNAAQLIAAYRRRLGTQITNIGGNTEVYVNQAIADWYKTDAGLPELIGMLEQFFSPARARLIAVTEMAYVASQVAHDMMVKYGITQWQWDAFLDGVTCDLCLDLMAQSKKKPFGIDDPMPPDPSHPGCRCGVYFIGVDVIKPKEK